MQNNNTDLIMSQEEFKALEELVDLLKSNHATQQHNMRTETLRLIHAVSTLGHIKKRNGV